MADKAELLAEAYRRGLLPPDRKAAYEEAARRGLVPPIANAKPAMKNGRLPGEVPFLPSTGALANFNRGLGVGDELAAGFATVGDLVTGKVKDGKTREFIGNVGNAFNSNLAKQRGLEDTYAEQRPNSAAFARGTGTAVTAAVPVGQAANAFSQTSRLAAAGQGAVLAGVQGAGYAALDRGSLGERVADAGKAAINPLALALGATAGALSLPRTRAKTPKAKAVELDQLQAAKTAAYRAVDDAGIHYTPQGFSDFVGDARSVLQNANISPTRHPKAFSMLSDLEKRASQGHAPTLTQLDQLRQEIRRDVVDVPDKAERFMGRKIIDALDGFVEKAAGPQVAGGQAANAADLLAKARTLNSRVRKVEAVETAVEKARLRAGSTGSGGNIDNATRQNLRAVMEKTPNLTQEERAALETVVMGGKGQNALRQIGKLSPSGNGLMAGLNLAGAASLGPLGAIPGAAGLTAKFVADRQTQRNVQEVLRIMSTERPSPAQIAQAQQLVSSMANSPAASALRRVVAARQARAAGALGAMTAGEPSGRPRNALSSARP